MFVLLLAVAALAGAALFTALLFVIGGLDWPATPIAYDFALKPRPRWWARS